MSLTISYNIGETFYLRGMECEIISQTDIDKVLVRVRSDGDIVSAHIRELKKRKQKGEKTTRPIESFTDAQWKIAKFRYEVIRPVLETPTKKHKIIAEQAAKFDVATRTIIRWIDRHQSTGTLSSLVPNNSNKRGGKLSKSVEKIITEAIKSKYLTKQRGTQKAVIKEVARLCKKANQKKPADNTIRERIKALDLREVSKKRDGKKASREKYDLVKGQFPDADFPLATVQIDHTQLDLELVDDEDRLPISRPWLTLAIDSFSRMITGMYLSLDHPSAFSVGMCIRNSVLEKDVMISKLGIEGEWPVWGKMRKLHFDNGKDFKSATIIKACEEHKIDIDYRPVNTPNYGAHIERMMGTINTSVHSLPGTTFSNILKKGINNPREGAAITLDEARRILLLFIVGDYHQRLHSSLGQSPLSKWREGINGTDKRAGRGIISTIEDPERFALDFLPLAERSIQRTGITWDRINYSSEILQRWVGVKKGGQNVKFTVRRDPHDISRIYFLDPELEEYFEIPYRDTGYPSISVWELRAIIKRLRDKGQSEIDEELIFRTYDSIEHEVSTAKKKTTAVRRAQQRKKDNAVRLETEPKQRPRLIVNNTDEAENLDSDDEQSPNVVLVPRWREID